MQALPLSKSEYKPYGDIISAGEGVSGKSANQGSAARFDFLGDLQNLRGAKAKPNVCIFRCEPRVGSSKQFDVELLERHPQSTQLFIPMAETERYLVVVCLGEKKPDLKTLRAFVATGAQGITYRPGVWHHPLIAMDAVSDFACVVFEDGSEADCESIKLEKKISVAIDA